VSLFFRLSVERHREGVFEFWRLNHTKYSVGASLCLCVNYRLELFAGLPVERSLPSQQIRYRAGRPLVLHRTRCRSRHDATHADRAIFVNCQSAGRQLYDGRRYVVRDSSHRTGSVCALEDDRTDWSIRTFVEVEKAKAFRWPARKKFFLQVRRQFSTKYLPEDKLGPLNAGKNLSALVEHVEGYGVRRSVAKISRCRDVRSDRLQ